MVSTPTRHSHPASAIARLPRSGRVFIGANAGEPRALVSALGASATDFHDLEVVQVLSFGCDPLLTEEARGHIRMNALFIGPAARAAVQGGQADYTPVFLSEIPALFQPGGPLPLDAALVQVSPPDSRGWCSLGVSVDTVRTAVDSARLVIAEINPHMPRTHGDSFVHISRLAHIVEVDHPLPELPPSVEDPISDAISHHVAELIEDGCTLQTGIGAIPDAVLRRLSDRRDLGIHTEMLSDGVMDLMEQGVITGARKSIYPGKAVTSFVLGSERLYRFVHDNPAIEMQPSHVVNDPIRIARNRHMVAINSALSIDLTGQVNSDSIGTRFYSGIGGQVDFIRGAADSEGGRPIIALPSTAREGKVSRIVPVLAEGAGVVTSRGDVHHVVTEWGRVDLHGRTVRQRVRALISLADPQFRDSLAREAHRLGWS